MQVLVDGRRRDVLLSDDGFPVVDEEGAIVWIDELAPVPSAAPSLWSRLLSWLGR